MCIFAFYCYFFPLCADEINALQKNAASIVRHLDLNQLVAYLDSLA